VVLIPEIPWNLQTVVRHVKDLRVAGRNFALVVAAEAARPSGIDGGALQKYLRYSLGVEVAGGQDQFKGKILRSAHLGFTGDFDILTVLAALELPPARDVDGVSLLGEIPETRALFAESFDGKGELASALRSGSRKLVRHRGRSDALYDLASDPNEARDLAGDAVAETSARAAELAAWRKAQTGAGAAVELSPEEAERLKALGYLQ